MFDTAEMNQSFSSGRYAAEWVKFLLHRPKAEQGKRLEKLEAEGRIGPDD